MCSLISSENFYDNVRDLLDVEELRFFDPITLTQWPLQRRSHLSCLNVVLYKHLKVFGVKFQLREIRRIFFTKIRYLKLRKMPKLLNFRFPAGCYSLNSDNTELKRSSIIFFSVSRRHRWAVEGKVIENGGSPIAPKTTSANAASASP